MSITSSYMLVMWVFSSFSFSTWFAWAWDFLNDIWGDKEPTLHQQHNIQQFQLRNSNVRYKKKWKRTFKEHVLLLVNPANHSPAQTFPSSAESFQATDFLGALWTTIQNIWLVTFANVSQLIKFQWATVPFTSFSLYSSFLFLMDRNTLVYICLSHTLLCHWRDSSDSYCATVSTFSCFNFSNSSDNCM